MARNQLTTYPAATSIWKQFGSIWKPLGPVPAGDCFIAHNFKNGTRHFIVRSPDPAHDPDFQALVAGSPTIPLVDGLSDSDKLALLAKYPDAVQDVQGDPTKFTLLLVTKGGPLVDISPLSGSSSSQQAQSQ